jgi:hypothetical protein
MAEVIEDIEVILSEPQEVLMTTRAQIILDMAGQGGGKSQNIGYHTGLLITTLPRARGFIGANTYDQLSGATLKNCYEVWRLVYGLTEYGPDNPTGSFVVDRKPPAHFQKYIKFKSYKNVMSFYNGAIVVLGSLENYEAQDGKEFAWAHLDETKDTKEVAVKDVITGRLRQRGLWITPEGDLVFMLNDEAGKRLTNDAALARGLIAWNPLFIHTSPAGGLTTWLNDWFKLDVDRSLIKAKVTQKDADFYHKENALDQTCAVIYSAYHNKENLPPGKLERQERSLGPDKALKLVHGYPFSKTGGEWFNTFNRLIHVKPTPFLPGEPLHGTWDFNVVPYMTKLAVQIVYVTRYWHPDGYKVNEPEYGYKAFRVMQIRVYKEYCFDGERSSTEAICNQYKEDHPYKNDYFFYGDASGDNRIPGLGYSNFDLIREALIAYTHNDSDRVVIPNVGVFKRRDLLNDIFGDRIPEIEIVIDPSCENLIKDCEEVKVGPKGKIKAKKKDENTGEKFEEVGHTSDALEYLVTYVAADHIK